MSEHTSANGGAEATGTATGPEIPNADRRALYEHVLEHGPTRPRRIQQALFPGDRRAARQHIALLRRNGLLVEDGDRVRVGVDVNRLADDRAVDIAGTDSTVEFRPAYDRDRSALRDVVEAVADGGTHVEAATATAAVADGRPLQRHDSAVERAVYVATVGDTVCGWAHVEAPVGSGVTRAATLTGGVSPERREVGLGTRMLTFVEEWAAERGYGSLYQHLPATNRPGIDFLTDRGWTVEARVEDRYSVGEADADEVILRRAVGD